ncbi:NAD(P)-binding protein [Mollisia scopiformis]|uniref:NAD(P)-binding protein n=1 Tax=Mollisia scopiformis TaxID=149040 RepID=A0A194XEE4_MOLSC|nr:NAD(P)-binding protein [Mollisia scopiformis]KUJ18560.1 NAD(P)-binding protein [Mollisia scopiformis]
MAQATTVLITGANRGIGKVLLETYLARPNHTVIAAVRDPQHSTSQSLPSLSTASGTKLVLVKIDSNIDTDAPLAIKTLTQDHKITRLDLVIANAGLCDWFGPTISLPVEQLTKTFQVNTIAPLLLFQATYPLLQKSSNPKFVFVSSSVGSVTNAHVKLPFNCAQYGASKAALNYLARKLHSEVQDVTIFPAHPGWLNTEMGVGSAKPVGLESALTDVEEGVKGLVGQIDKATREETSGEFVMYDGSVTPW